MGRGKIPEKQKKANRKIWLEKYRSRPDVRERMHLAQEKYNSTSKAKTRRLRHQKTQKYKSTQEKFRLSQKFKKWQEEYLARPDVKEVMNARSLEWHRKPENVKKMAPAKWKSNLKTKYGITPEDYSRMMIAQDGVCAICRGVDVRGKKLAVDHNHVTGQVRGLLCGSCNSAIGLLKENPDRIARALSYINDHVAVGE